MDLFLSYRRSDTQHVVGRLSEQLLDTPGIDSVFMDIGGIQPGADFVDALHAALKRSQVVLVVIGAGWSGSADGNAPRIQDSGDFVRQEVASALEGDARLIPVLVDGAAMPDRDVLPDELHPLLSRNAVFLRHTSFSQDVEILRDAIFGRGPRTPMGRFFRRNPILTTALKAMLGFVGAAALIIAFSIVQKEITGVALNTLLGGVGPVYLLVAGALVAGTVGLPYAWPSARRRLVPKVE